MNEAEKIIIGVDHGFGYIKTVHHVFPASLVELPQGQTYGDKRILEVNGKYYELQLQPSSVQSDKLENENYRLLTMIAIAKELGSNSSVHVILGAGLPIGDVRRTCRQFNDYLMKDNPMKFKYEGKSYEVTIDNLGIFPQGLSGAISHLNNIDGRVIVADVGTLTVDVFTVLDNEVEQKSIASWKNGVNTLIKNVKENVSSVYGAILETKEIEKILKNPERFDDEYIPSIKELAKKYVRSIEKELQNYGYSNAQYILLGGGASIMKKFASGSINKTTYLEDTKINAKGYEQIISKSLGK